MKNRRGNKRREKSSAVHVDLLQRVEYDHGHQQRSRRRAAQSEQQEPVQFVHDQAARAFDLRHSLVA